MKTLSEFVSLKALAGYSSKVTVGARKGENSLDMGELTETPGHGSLSCYRQHLSSSSNNL